MRRYKFLSTEDMFKALNKLRSAFLAAKDGNEVDRIIKGVLTHDERMKVGRRIQIAELIQSGMKYREIANQLKVGMNTVEKVHKLINENPDCYELIFKRIEKVEKEYKIKSYKKIGSPKLLLKKKVYTGFTRKDVKR